LLNIMPCLEASNSKFLTRRGSKCPSSHQE
jgi:hypothetical protein